MNEWIQIVAKYFGHSEGALHFIKDVKGHIATYRAMREADKLHPDPKGTFESLLEIREQAGILGTAFIEAQYQVISRISEGMHLDNRTPNETIDADQLGQHLLNIAWAIDTLVAEIGDDEDIKRRGFHKHMSRNILVKGICESYRTRLNEFPSAGDPRFTEILEAILAPLGIPHSNLHRVLQDSIPPGPQSH